MLSLNFLNCSELCCYAHTDFKMDLILACVVFRKMKNDVTSGLEQTGNQMLAQETSENIFKRMEHVLEDQHQMFIQAFMWKKICSTEEVRSLHKKCHDRNRVPLSDLKAFVEKINSAIKPMNMAISKGIDEITGEQYYVLIHNATDNGISRLSAEYKTNEIELFKKIVNCIIESNNGKVTSTSILNLSDEVHISKKEADEIIARFCEDGWLIENGGYIYFSTRAIVELQHFFKVHFEDAIVLCSLCRNVVFQGDTCKNKNCGRKLHNHCKTKYFSDVGSNVCPNCRTSWL